MSAKRTSWEFDGGEWDLSTGIARMAQQRSFGLFGTQSRACIVVREVSFHPNNANKKVDNIFVGKK